MSIKYVEDTGSMLIVKIPKTRDSKAQTFTIDNKMADGVNLVEVYRKYVSLRDYLTTHDRLFVCYQYGHCHKQPVGINKIGKIPSEIAKYLGLDARGFTGHSFKRTAVKLRATEGRIF